jgi:hypothetical protein
MMVAAVSIDFVVADAAAADIALWMAAAGWTTTVAPPVGIGDDADGNLGLLLPVVTVNETAGGGVVATA